MTEMMGLLFGMRVVLSRIAQGIYATPTTLILPQHSQAAEECISAELVECTLGRRSRPGLVPRPPFAFTAQ